MEKGPCRILVVDDEPDIAESLVDLLVTDFMMPGRNGVQLLREAQRLEPGLANILVTAYGPEAVEAAGPPTPDHVLHKPLDIGAFEGAVNEALAPA